MFTIRFFNFFFVYFSPSDKVNEELENTEMLQESVSAICL